MILVTPARLELALDIVLEISKNIVSKIKRTTYLYFVWVWHHFHFFSLITRPPPKGVPGVIDQTRGLLNYVEENCAPAVYTPELRYVCIAGRYIQGAPLLGNSAAASDEILAVDTPSEGGDAVIVSSSDNSTSTPSAVSWRARFVGQGYKQVCGRADVWGDGVVPEMAAHLEGALNVSFDGVYHSPVGSDDEQRPWYGSPAILKQWVHHLLSWDSDIQEELAAGTDRNWDVSCSWHDTIGHQRAKGNFFSEIEVHDIAWQIPGCVVSLCR